MNNRISSRDIKSAIPREILQPRMNEIKLINIQGFDNYTQEVLIKLHELFKEHKIESHPVKDGNSMVEWMDRSNRYHRPNNLPAKEWEDGAAECYKHGNPHRSNGPWAISGDGRYYSWALDGVRIVKKNYTNECINYKKYDFNETVTPITKQEYDDIIKKHFPDAVGY